jgi:hypothetical protein
MKNKVIQIVPDHEWGGCLAIVNKAEPWGVEAYVHVPLQGAAYIRLNRNEFEVIGDAVFVMEDEDE